MSWDKKINFNINMEHQLWPILQKVFICDKTRQCFIWSLIQSYVYRLYPVLCISTLSPPPPPPPPHACKAYFSATPKDGDTIAWLDLAESQWWWHSLGSVGLHFVLYSQFALFKPAVITMVSKISHWATICFWWECKISRPILAVTNQTNAVRQFNLHAR